jgi:mannose-6-phosphate isomerase-like protein (cupin superfamily)
LAIVEAARSNDAFRREVMTGSHQQVVLMTIPPGGEIGEEVHPDTDQAPLFVAGEGEEADASERGG